MKLLSASSLSCSDIGSPPLRTYRCHVLELNKMILTNLDIWQSGDDHFSFILGRQIRIEWTVQDSEFGQVGELPDLVHLRPAGDGRSRQVQSLQL
jgi:hypothetical protein